MLGETPKFSHFYLRQMRAEELYESLVVATEAEKTQGSYEEQEKPRAEWLRQFVIAFGTDEGDESTTFNGTIPQALMMFNGDLVKKPPALSKGSFVWQLATIRQLKNPEKIDYLFMAGFGRGPNKIELACRQSPADRPQRQHGWRHGRISWWAVLNSNEFIMNH